MDIDVYSYCPCGSGKKLKFCCLAIIDEMEKVAKLQENNQSKMAIQVLEGLENSHPESAWVYTSRAAILLEAGQGEDAKQVLNKLLEKEPDHQLGIALFATASFSYDGYDKAKPAIQRALQRCEETVPDVISSLAMGIAAVMHGRGQFLAAREYLTLAMRLSDEQTQQQIFSRLLEFDGNDRILYPFRSVHELEEYSGSEEIEKEVAKATRLSNVGCAGVAAERFEKLTEKEPDNAILWQNLGVCRAWDGDESGTSVALHRAAELYDDFETAVECETVAQLLDLNLSEDRQNLGRREFRVKSVGKLLTELDKQDRFVRIPVEPPEDGNQETAGLPAGLYQVLSQPPLTDWSNESLSVDSVPTTLAQIAVFSEDNQDGSSPEAQILGMEGDDLDAGIELFLKAGGDEVAATEDADDDEISAVESIPSEYASIRYRPYFDPKTPGLLQKKVVREYQDRFLNEIWPTTQLAALSGKTPQEAAGNPEFKLSLTAAVHVLDAYCNQNGYPLDVVSILERLQLAPPEPIEVDEQTPFNTFSAMKLQRLRLDSLDDHQLRYTLNRALLLHHRRFLYDVLSTVESRPACLAEVDSNRVYSSLVDLCQERFDREGVLRWTAKGRELSKTAENSFESELQWQIREMSVRLEDPNDPELKPLLKHLWDYYGTKLPQIREYLQQLVEEAGISPPWQEAEGIVTADSAVGTAAEGGVWTPSTSTQAEEGEKKLWLPGQD